MATHLKKNEKSEKNEKLMKFYVNVLLIARKMTNSCITQKQPWKNRENWLSKHLEKKALQRPFNNKEEIRKFLIGHRYYAYYPPPPSPSMALNKCTP